MIKLPITPEQEDDLFERLVNSHQMRIEVQILDRDENVLGSLTMTASQVLEGEVQVDSTQDVSRSLSLRLLDPLHQLQFDSDSPVDGALAADRFVRVWYQVPFDWSDE